MSKFRAGPHLTALKSFQRATVDHVARRFYEDRPQARRFLVADETGLGKSLVARGVIARSIECLQDDPRCERIDVVYVCSNAEIAEQNLKRLDVLESGSSHHATRLTLLAQRADELSGPPHPEVGKRVNLVSFTPGTSFDVRSGTGRAEERALLCVILRDALGYAGRVAQRAAAVVLQGWSGLASFERSIASAEWNLRGDPPDPTITKPFLSAIRQSGLQRRFARAVEALGRRTRTTVEEQTYHGEIVGELRAALARAAVDALKPDLIILDEFQRFRHLLAVDDPKYREAAELAHELFDHGEAKVLLLSATPYKPFTYTEEAAAGDDHVVDLRRTLTFLAGGNGAAATVDSIVDDLEDYRRAAVDGSPTGALRSKLESSLTRLMSRTERPRLGKDGMLREVETIAQPVEDDDIMAYVALRRLADRMEAPVAVDYWKSTPYFVNFGDGYVLGDRLRERLRDVEHRPTLRSLLRSTQHLDREAVEQLLPVEPGNARMRHLLDDTIARGWWKLLWVPPSAPYDTPRGPYAEPGLDRMTKRLVFSSWTATPTALAALLSHDVTRRIAPSREALDTATTRLDWRVEGRRPGAMTTLALFWPAPGVADAVHPFNEPVAVPVGAGRATGAEPWYWTAVFSHGGAAPPDLAADAAAAALAGEAGEDAAEEGTRLALHVELALALRDGRRDVDAERRTAPPEDADAVVAALARYGPGNIAYRCLRRIAAGSPAVSAGGVWRAAAAISSGLRSLFSRSETILLLDQLLPDPVYWRAVLQYCAWGNLEAVLDEYLHHLAEPDRLNGLSDEKLLGIALLARTALTLRPARYEAFDPFHPDRPIAFMSRFALRYGNKRAGVDETNRLPDVRTAFNSPFWPFVLATTSIGQEGLDFHWWCHAAVHWNTPASPVDFEQREGRVHRYSGHAIRKNLAEHHGPEMRAAGLTGRHPWDAAFEAGIRSACNRYGDLAPHWITEGSTKIERHLLPYPLSHDAPRYRKLKDDLAVYRLAFGQPRQEDLIALLKQRGVHLDPREIDRLRLDLRPPCLP